MKLHDKIRSVRNQNKLTQEQVAEKLGISTNGYSKIEKGQTKLSIERLQEIANIFDIDIIELINSDEKKVYVQFNENSNQHGHNHGMTFYDGNSDMLHEVEKLKLTVAYQQQEIEHLKEIISLLKKDKD